MRKRAFITGITGQDGSYLAELLRSKGYEVHGLIRRTSRTETPHLQTAQSAEEVPTLHYGDLADGPSLTRILRAVGPDEIYNLGAQSDVRISFAIPEYTADITGIGTLRLLQSVVDAGLTKKTRFYQASSSEMFGACQERPQTETSRFQPRSPYGCAKLFAHHTTLNFRAAYGMFACCGILFNHESPRRGENFVTRKISMGAARIKKGLQPYLTLGNLDAERDWGYAKEYVEGMWLMLQQDTPDDYVLATGACYTVREFLEASFRHLDLDWRDYVRIDKALLRPTDIDVLVGDSTKARRMLSWAPKTDMGMLAKMMVDADMRGC
jgi:GDPmannose 4,6-dehydratase